MNTADFINVCQVAGYASKATATQYCKESGRGIIGNKNGRGQ
jgi:hypothetical protein